MLSSMYVFAIFFLAKLSIKVYSYIRDILNLSMTLPGRIRSLPGPSSPRRTIHLGLVASQYPTNIVPCHQMGLLDPGLRDAPQKVHFYHKVSSWVNGQHK
jgi:hypothetical protein